MLEGLEYFPLDVRLDEKFQLLEAEFGLMGFAVVVRLFQRIYEGKGYCCEWTNEVVPLFARENRVGAGAISEIVKAAIRRGIFDRDLFERFRILTSRGIQKRYFEAVSRRKAVTAKREYLLLPHAQLPKNVRFEGENDGILPKMKTNKSKGKKRKGKKRRGQKRKRRRGQPRDLTIAKIVLLRINLKRRTNPLLTIAKAGVPINLEDLEKLFNKF